MTTPFDMAHYVYLFGDYMHENIQAGHCSELGKVIEFYTHHNSMSLLYPTDQYLFRLVYLEEVTTEGQAIDRIVYFAHLPLNEKVKLIESINPEWMQLVPGINIVIN